MSTAWTLLASEICTDALQHLGVLGEGEAANGDQQQTALRGLDAVLKELPLYGYAWPKLSTEGSLTWGGAGVQTITLPTDYYGYPVVWTTVNGQKTPLTQIPHALWVEMTNRTASGLVTHFYVSPANVLSLYPVPPTVDPALTIQYQKIVDDADLATTPDVLQVWKNALGYGVANETGLKFGAPDARRAEIAARWAEKRERAMQSSVASESICFEVRE